MNNIIQMTHAQGNETEYEKILVLDEMGNIFITERRVENGSLEWQEWKVVRSLRKDLNKNK